MDVSIELEKSSYPEQTVRKSLYWLSEDYQWQLNETENHWLITIFVSQESLEKATSRFHQLLNDFLLRHQLDIKTQFLREKIIFSALEKIANANS